MQKINYQQAIINFSSYLCSLFDYEKNIFITDSDAIDGHHGISHSREAWSDENHYPERRFDHAGKTGR